MKCITLWASHTVDYKWRSWYHHVTLFSAPNQQVWHHRHGNHHSCSVIQLIFHSNNSYQRIYSFKVGVTQTYLSLVSPRECQRGHALYSIRIQSQGGHTECLKLLCKWELLWAVYKNYIYTDKWKGCISDYVGDLFVT